MFLRTQRKVRRGASAGHRLSCTPCLPQVWLQSGCKCHSHSVVDPKAMCPYCVGAYDKSITSTSAVLHPEKTNVRLQSGCLARPSAAHRPLRPARRCAV